MTHVTEVLVELTDAVHLIKRRPSANALATSLIDSLCAKIALIQQWSPGAANMLCTSIDGSGLTAVLADQLNAAVDARMQSHIAVAARPVVAAGAPPRDQHIRHPHHFMSGRDWALLDDPAATPDQRDQIVATRLQKLGVRRASEDGLVKWAVAVLLIAEQKISGSWPSYTATYNRVFIVSWTLIGRRRRITPQHVIEPLAPLFCCHAHWMCAYRSAPHTCVRVCFRITLHVHAYGNVYTFPCVCACGVYMLISVYVPINDVDAHVLHVRNADRANHKRPHRLVVNWLSEGCEVQGSPEDERAATPHVH